MDTPCVQLAILIDDNDIDLFVQKRFIEMNHFASNVITFLSPIDALNYLAKANADGSPAGVIFLDLNMPVMDGFGFLESLLEIPGQVAERTKVVVLTSSSSSSDREKASTYKNVFNFISKPLSTQCLAELREQIIHMPS